MEKRAAMRDSLVTRRWMGDRAVLAWGPRKMDIWSSRFLFPKGTWLELEGSGLA